MHASALSTSKPSLLWNSSRLFFELQSDIWNYISYCSRAELLCCCLATMWKVHELHSSFPPKCSLNTPVLAMHDGVCSLIILSICERWPATKTKFNAILISFFLCSFLLLNDITVFILLVLWRCHTHRLCVGDRGERTEL